LAIESFRKSLDGKTYEWDGYIWFDIETNLSPPASVQIVLNKMKWDTVRKQVSRRTDFQELLDKAKYLNINRGDLHYAEILAQHVVDNSPCWHQECGAAAILGSILRHQGRFVEALKVTDKYKDDNYSPIHATRAATFCDLEEYEKAHESISKANPEDYYVQAVIKRIDKARPDLTHSRNLDCVPSLLLEIFKKRI
ncbi:MAG: hypothetical protein V3S46_03570, partial [Nitrospinota bacterium]